MMQISLVLAYAPDRPEGDVEDRLELTLPLAAGGQAEEDQAGPFAATRRLSDGRMRTMEMLRDESGWALRRTGAATDPDDAPLWQVDARVFRPGELVQLQRPAGEVLTFRIVSVAAL